MASEALNDPPGELMYIEMSRSGAIAARWSSWAMTTLATPSSIGVPTKMIRSESNRL